MEDTMLTTIDNPYNPFEDFDNWYAFDSAQGYNSCALLARIAKGSDDISDADESDAIEQAIDEIVKLNPLGLYTKAKKQTKSA